MRNIEYIGDLIERTLADESYEEVNESHNKEKMMILIKKRNGTTADRPPKRVLCDVLLRQHAHGGCCEGAWLT